MRFCGNWLESNGSSRHGHGSDAQWYHNARIRVSPKEVERTPDAKEAWLAVRSIRHDGIVTLGEFDLAEAHKQAKDYCPKSFVRPDNTRFYEEVHQTDRTGPSRKRIRCE